MELLLVEAQPGKALLLRDRLTAAGHHVESCTDEDTGGPCRSVSVGVECPLRRHVDLAVVARGEGVDDSLFEMGAICAERHRVPVMCIDPAEPDALDQIRVAAASGKDRLEARYAAEVRSALSEHGVITVEAERQPDRVHVTVGVLASDARARAAVADRVREVVRRFDRYVSTIDVSVTTAA